ncbi:MAG: DUF305 domain-containing protein [Leifsonia xyli]|nr:MAG: DUF305 domain-containing protein [Leifsonia xyli]
MRIRTLALASGALAAALVLAGCSSNNDNMDGMAGMDHGSMGMGSPSSSSADANAADSMFAMMMIPHHQQAVVMSDMMLAKDGLDPRITELAQQIKDAQGPEIDKMKSWLDGWGTPYDESSAMSMGDMMSGMLSDDDLSALDAATGTDASKLFLTQMIAHHEGALEMAQSEVDNGQNADAVALAKEIVTAQTAEIATMKELLASL